MRVNKKQIRGFARIHGYGVFLTFLSRTPQWSVDRRTDYVREKVRQAVVQAGREVPFYRRRFAQAGFDPRVDFRDTDDLKGLPVLTKEEIREHADDLINRRYLPVSVVANTSGTTGEPSSYWLNESYVAFDYAVMCRHWARAGYRFRSKYAALRSYVPDSNEAPLWKYNWWQNTLYMSAYHLSAENCSGYIDAILRFRPKFLRGYSSALTVLAELAYDRKEEFDFLAGVFTASEMVLPAERATIEATFGKKLFDWYGMTEPAVVITERTHHLGMEVEWEYGFPEFERTSDSNETSEYSLVATSLHNPVMPLIRFETGDRVEIPDLTNLGENGIYPMVTAINGRKDECLITPDGRRLPTLNFYSLLQEVSEVLQFQFVHSMPDLVELRLLLRSGERRGAAVSVGLRGRKLSEKEVIEKVDGEIRKRLGTTMRLRIATDGAFERKGDGKIPVLIVRPEARAIDSANKTATHLR